MFQFNLDFLEWDNFQFQALIIDYITILATSLTKIEKKIDFNQLLIDYNLSF